VSEAKPRMIEIKDSWTLRVLEANQEDLACPHLVDGRFVDAEDFAAWKRLQSTSGADK
jgi:hypothetical protein